MGSSNSCFTPLTTDSGATTTATAGAEPIAAYEPAGSASIPVSTGLFSAELGGGSMPAITPGVFFDGTGNVRGDVSLRVWFSATGAAGSFVKLSPDRKLSSVPFALVAGTVGRSAITSDKIAAGAVGTPALATGAVGTSALAAGAVKSASIADGAVGNSQLGTNAVQAFNISAGAVGCIQLASAAVGPAPLASGAAAANLGARRPDGRGQRRGGAFRERQQHGIGSGGLRQDRDHNLE